MHCMSVDFPEPDGPMTAVNWPRSKATLTSSSARTAAGPLPYVLPRFTARAAWVSTATPVMVSSVAVGGWPAKRTAGRDRARSG